MFEVIIYVYYSNCPNMSKNEKFRFEYLINNPEVHFDDFKRFFNGQNYEGRLPDGLEYKNVPVIVFGGSYAYGNELQQNQTFSYKLSHLIKHPVINRALPGGGLSFMYFQTNTNYLYEAIPDVPEYIFYIMINDHYRRMYINNFNIPFNSFYLHYAFKNGKFIIEDYKNPYKNFIRSLYITRFFNHVYALYIVKHNPEKVTDLFIEYLNQSRKNIEKHYNKKLKFVVLLYEDREILHKDILKKKLEDNNYIVVETSELTDLDLYANSIPNDHHPTEQEWDILVPLITKHLGLK